MNTSIVQHVFDSYSLIQRHKFELVLLGDFYELAASLATGEPLNHVKYE